MAKYTPTITPATDSTVVDSWYEHGAKTNYYRATKASQRYLVSASMFEKYTTLAVTGQEVLK